MFTVDCDVGHMIDTASRSKSVRITIFPYAMAVMPLRRKKINNMTKRCNFYDL